MQSIEPPVSRRKVHTERWLSWLTLAAGAVLCAIAALLS
jgi:hypothetical protein